MKGKTSPELAPIFRSETQARILGWLLLDPSREQPITSLAEVADVSEPAVYREVQRLLAAGLLMERRAGQARLVRANTASRFYAPILSLLMRTYGPVTVVPELLRGIPDIDGVFIFGSWAARYHGEPGHTPRDVDVLVVGNPPGREVRRAASLMEERLGVPAHVTTVPAEEWAHEGSEFVREVRSRPLVDLTQEVLDQ